MVLKPIKRAVVPSPLENSRKFDEFVTQYFNKCDDLLSYTQRYPIVKETEVMTVQRQNRNPNEDHRWLRRDVYITKRETSYDELKTVLFLNRAEHLAKWMPQMNQAECVESIVPNLCEVYRYAFKSQGLKAKRDYCQLVVKREFLGETARPKPRLFTPSASMANLAMSIRSQSTINLHQMQQGGMSSVHGSQVNLGMYNDGSMPTSPLSPVGGYHGGPSSQAGGGYKGMKNARSFVDLHDIDREASRNYAASMHTVDNPHMAQQGNFSNYPPPPPLPAQHQQKSNYVGLNPQDSVRGMTQGDNDDDSMLGDDARKPIRRFQIVTIPVLHRNCTSQRGYVRAFYETYEEVREYSNGDVEWTCVHHSDFSGWVPSFLADNSIANAFPKEADALLGYLQRNRVKPLHNEY
ncbi:hypothetical protein GQ54DRAFT_300544 [Martensiomyces pterosporus]|nr:hypothetical protein GQ54DRAFT_300544 [Martensiomyces pterosporus]